MGGWVGDREDEREAGPKRQLRTGAVRVPRERTTPDVTSLDSFVNEHTKPILVSQDKFWALTRLAIQLIYGDYIPGSS
jgi:hypothetical protein